MLSSSSSVSPMPPLVCAADLGYLEPLTVLIASVAEAHPPRALALLRLIVVHHDLPPGAIALVGGHAGRLGLDVDVRKVAPPVGYPVSGWASTAVYLRLQIPTAVPDASRVLYLDTDTMVLDDLRPLLVAALYGNALVAVRDPQNPGLGSGMALAARPQLGLPAGRDYFNSGVMLLDLDAGREAELFDRAAWFLVNHPELVRLWDQDTLNFAAADRWVRLDARWNTFAFSALARMPGFVHEPGGQRERLTELLAREQDAAVLHFAGPAKPLQAGYPDVVARHRYRALAAATAVLA